MHDETTEYGSHGVKKMNPTSKLYPVFLCQKQKRGGAYDCSVLTPKITEKGGKQ